MMFMTIFKCSKNISVVKEMLCVTCLDYILTEKGTLGTGEIVMVTVNIGEK